MLEDFQNIHRYPRLTIEEKVLNQESDERLFSEHFNWQNLTIKRAVDLGLSLGYMILVGSWLFPIIAILIKLDSKGPVFFKQSREGLNNTTFNCYKFRTMVVNKDADIKQATRNDPRITRVGKILRKTSLDELPQLLNVIYGNMSLVGPRPQILKQNDEYAEKIEGFKNRHLVKPGLTGLAQAKGYRGETQVPNSMYFRYKLDMYYIKNWDPYFDIKIIGMTIKSIFTDNGNAH
ncbi:sugar transferase [Algoriphagus zhangzhouensis]|uniref:Putative colanic acid biosysnthesis UDP-glucose lipid carrier transferase n=1 Tax=Algoriphagus zhangzhouensis TaxID=1073327 RepID=A0A1M7Z444_9BACT|nr:sugar transferase [Algoriphagus zhangzhouensis]TDY48379.1 putative colanic acid biosynthesis UDP-glucose lipid carrier transferase [Algoriphagus zhangzhouensis]SHO59426.1 putative colanic acid biosysnthesis UDP-glucose lipid carrier transferase [Algoriphagus zhangzhouensis]